MSRLNFGFLLQSACLWDVDPLHLVVFDLIQGALRGRGALFEEFRIASVSVLL